MATPMEETDKLQSAQVPEVKQATEAAAGLKLVTILIMLLLSVLYKAELDFPGS